MPAVLDANLDDTAVFPLDDKNRNTRHTTLAQLRVQILLYVSAEIAAIQADIAAIDLTLTGVASEISAIQSAVATLISEVNDLIAWESIVNAEISSIGDTLTYIQSEIGAINTTLAHLQSEINTINSTLASLQSQIDAINTILDSLQSQINSIVSTALANPMTTHGDMIVGGVSPAGVATRLPVDLNGKILVMWGTPPVPTWLYLNLAALIAAGGSGAPSHRVPFVYDLASPWDNQAQPGASYETTHTVTAGVTRVEYELWGGGGAFDAGGPDALTGYLIPCGGGGAYAWGSAAVTPGDSIAIVVGTAGGYATPAGDSSINGTELVAGAGVNGDGTTPNGAGGTASGTLASQLLLSGEEGAWSDCGANGAVGIGGASPHGGNGAQQIQLVPPDQTSNGIAVVPALPSVNLTRRAGRAGGGGCYTGDFTTYPTCGRVIVWEYQ
jgi:prefoldin subunit 5